jgi:hypothetical protein
MKGDDQRGDMPFIYAASSDTATSRGHQRIKASAECKKNHSRSLINSIRQAHGILFGRAQEEVMHGTALVDQ